MEYTRVRELLKTDPAVVESGTITVDSDFFIPYVGEIDMVGVRSGRLILACVTDELQGRHLRQLSEIFRWVRENSNVLAHVYQAKGLSEGFSISIWYLCESIGADAQLLLPSLVDFPFAIYQYRSVKSKGRELLEVKQVGLKTKVDVIKIPANLNFELSEKERGAFLSSDDEITYTGPNFNS